MVAALDVVGPRRSSRRTSVIGNLPARPVRGEGGYRRCGRFTGKATPPVRDAVTRQLAEDVDPSAWLDERIGLISQVEIAMRVTASRSGWPRKQTNFFDGMW